MAWRVKEPSLVPRLLTLVVVLCCSAAAVAAPRLSPVPVKAARAAGAHVVGLTGGIASGKSTVSRMLGELGVPVVDADVLARQIVEPGRPAYRAIVREFGRGVLQADGTLDRKKLGQQVFSDPVKLSRLNALTHGRIAYAARRAVAAHIAAGAKLVVYDAALIVEQGVQRKLDALVVVSVPEQTQLSRLMERDHLGATAARQRLAAQLPLATRLAAATHVIDNSGTPEQTRSQVLQLWKQLTTGRQ